MTSYLRFVYKKESESTELTKSYNPERFFVTTNNLKNQVQRLWWTVKIDEIRVQEEDEVSTQNYSSLDNDNNLNSNVIVKVGGSVWPPAV